MEYKVHQLNEVNLIKDFVFSGKSIFTIESTTTGKWFTYKVMKPKKSDKPVYWVSLFTGTDNNTMYSYIGTIFNDKFARTAKSKISSDSHGFKAFEFFYNFLKSNKTHPKINFYHAGHCAKCGKKLTTPESVTIGIGPICDGRV